MPQINALDLPEILHEVFSTLNANEIRKCRLVSASWNENGVDVLRRKRYPVEISCSWTKLKYGLPIMNERFQSLPFSAIQFECYFALRYARKQWDLFFNNHGCQLRELKLYFGYPPHASCWSTRFQRSLLTALIQTSGSLSSLTLNLQTLVASEEKFPSQDFLSPLFPKLKTLIVDFYYAEAFVRNIIERAPILETLDIKCGYFTYDRIPGIFHRVHVLHFVDLPRLFGILSKDTRIKFTPGSRSRRHLTTLRYLSKFLPITKEFSFYSANWDTNRKLQI